MEKGTKQETGRQDSMAGGTEANPDGTTERTGSELPKSGGGSPFSTDGGDGDKVCRGGASGNEDDCATNLQGDFNQLEPKGLIP
jgi:hypothetical protein